LPVRPILGIWPDAPRVLSAVICADHALTVGDRSLLPPSASTRLGAVAMSGVLPAAADVVIIGGGITGAGVAVDAAQRGLRTVLLERGDWASGTSSRSSKLVHGGLRYLQQKEVALVRENLLERQRLLDNAPHLVSLLPFVIPIFRRGGIAGAATDKAITGAYATALRLYDASGGARIGKTFEKLSPEETSQRLAGVTREATAGGFVYYDCQADDARLTLALVRTAAELGASVQNYTSVDRLVTHSDGSVLGVVLADGRQITARCVVNAAGVWAERFFASTTSGESARITPAKGVHVTFRATALHVDDAVVLPVPHDRRSLFIVPGAAIGCSEVVYVGTTDTPYAGHVDEPLCNGMDLDYVLDALNHWRSKDMRPLTPDDVVATWAGLRPLLSDARSERTADLSRRHAVLEDRQGLVSIVGGKLTTYRAMAEDAVDAVCRQLHQRTACKTAELSLHGAGGSAQAEREVAAQWGEAVASHLVHRHGVEAIAVAALMRDRADLGAPLVDGFPWLRAEVVHAVRNEMATCVDDVLVRRVRLLLADRDATATAIEPTIELMGHELSWDESQRRSQRDLMQQIIDSETGAMSCDS
jgi:glycerol-3-phosphate dehydrogenase